MKIKITLILLVLCISSSAYAIPVTWTFSGGATSGGFEFDADTSDFSNVSFAAFGETYSNLDYDLGGLGFDFFSDNTTSTPAGFLTFPPGLTDAGGMVDYAATFSSGFFSFDFDVGILNGVPTSTVSVPEPAAMTLLGLGLLGLGWTRRKAS